MKVTRMKPTPLAKAVGLSPSTLLRALDPQSAHSLERRSIDKIVQKFDVPPPDLFGALSSSQRMAPAEDELIACKTGPETLGSAAGATQSDWEVKTRALELAGVFPGDVVRADSNVEPRSRDLVVAQILDAKTVETIIRVYEPPYLLTETADPLARRKPLLVDNERVTVCGVIVRTVRIRD